jgi:hypothetical protein
MNNKNVVLQKYKPHTSNLVMTYDISKTQLKSTMKHEGCRLKQQHAVYIFMNASAYRDIDREKSWT